MDSQNLLEHLAELAAQLGISVRRTDLGGSGGSLVSLRGRQILFIDTLADPQDQLERLIGDFARLPNLDQIYIIPELRELLDATKRGAG